MSIIDPLVRFLHKNGLLESIPDNTVLPPGEKGPIARLASKGVLDENQAIKIVSEKLNVEFYDLELPELIESLDINDFKGKIDANFCRQYKILPLKRAINGVIVAFANPLDLDALQAVEFSLSTSIKPVIAKEKQIIDLIDKTWSSSLSDALKVAGDEDYGDVELIRGGGKEEEGEGEFDGQDVAPIVKLVNEILVDAINVQASDIHIEPTKNLVDIRFRIDGVMQKVLEVPKRLQSYLISRVKILSAMDVSERRRPQDGRLGVKTGNETVDMRVSTIPTSFGEKIVLRVMRSDFDKLKFKDIGLPAPILKSLETLLHSHSKLILVTGPTGSGKTTTLYTAINFLRDGKKNITTVEDPIEYKFDGVNQIQLNRAIDVTFASALRSILRQDPDIIMIGEIRDQETITIALQAALTGHLVLSTLHTNDAPNAITRIMNMGADPFVVSQCLAGILAQRLVRKVCTNCCQPVTELEIEANRAYIEAYKLDPKVINKACGCDKCFQTGYKGRMGIYSYLEISPEIARIMAQHGTIDDMVLAARHNGYRSIDESAADILRQGKSTFDELKGYLSLDAKVIRNTVKFDSSEGVKAKTDQNGNAQKTKILLVDDSPQVRKLLKVILEKEKFEVFEAENGKAGLEKIQSMTPDVVLCDLSMPMMNGEEFLLQMKASSSFRSIPVIMLTGDASSENEIKLLKLGASDFVSKKTSPDVLVSRIRRAMGFGLSK
ncbi:MAG: ATPase, T2SS/T4P/T4SS family [bacterium]|nr:ATPase, T2SS/T4P/T4SS family [bacterium]